jgi:FKBP-type peptidyl-prolyl cis-trans isomerase
LTIFLPFFSFFTALPLRRGPKRDPKRVDGVAVGKRRGRGPAFSQPTGKPAYFSGLFSVSEQLNLELLFEAHAPCLFLSHNKSYAGGMKHFIHHGMSFTVKKFGGLLMGLIMASSLQAQNIPEEEQEKLDISYAYGLIIGSDMKGAGIEFDYNALSQGLRDSIEESNPRMSLDEAISLVQGAYQVVMERQAEENQAKEVLFFEDNGKRQGIITTASGLQYEVIQRAGGKEKPGPEAMVQVNYEGKFIDGEIFDSSYERGEAELIPLNQVITGWAEGLQLMGVGDTFTFYIPSKLAYGEGGGGTIPPYTPLVFKVELLGILPPGEDQK